MKFNVMLSEDEIKQICSVYPSKQLVTGFNTKLKLKTHQQSIVCK